MVTRKLLIPRSKGKVAIKVNQAACFQSFSNQNKYSANRAVAEKNILLFGLKKSAKYKMVWALIIRKGSVLNLATVTTGLPYHVFINWLLFFNDFDN